MVGRMEDTTPNYSRTGAADATRCGTSSSAVVEIESVNIDQGRRRPATKKARASEEAPRPVIETARGMEGSLGAGTAEINGSRSRPCGQPRRRDDGYRLGDGVDHPVPRARVLPGSPTLPSPTPVRPETSEWTLRRPTRMRWEFWIRGAARRRGGEDSHGCTPGGGGPGASTPGGVVIVPALPSVQSAEPGFRKRPTLEKVRHQLGRGRPSGRFATPRRRITRLERLRGHPVDCPCVRPGLIAVAMAGAP